MMNENDVGVFMGPTILYAPEVWGNYEYLFVSIYLYRDVIYKYMYTSGGGYCDDRACVIRYIETKSMS